ncbi:hypothetical protein OEIGOIKO_03827 [Streptomyces chrestomyceticus JCM 4735]|uniref:DUF4232 domain-containing protein n=1 Tax=Streptomyces chrestomyceticus JCM 4735 TaxID=1306181 RepID=A0A7U9KVB2_9ACTN|nr:DUF4232 domain-containing protein [Streptomyces chrestomyceticus]GCD36074.1 hypothetical protein OEIGOIKO_03827 [Streptomyces chrestomyceticus JCM 4735]
MSGKQFGPYDPQDRHGPWNSRNHGEPRHPQHQQDRHGTQDQHDARAPQGSQDPQNSQSPQTPKESPDPKDEPQDPRETGPEGQSGQDTGRGVGEDELRRLLHSAVGDLEPAPDSLEQLRRAVPARRRRRRHAVVGAAAALLLGGTSIPAMVHVANFADGPEDRPANAASSQRTPGGTKGTHGEGTEHSGKPPAGRGGKKSDPGGKPAEPGKSPDAADKKPSAGTGTPYPSGTMDVTSPACSRAQLGNGVSSVGPADANGRVYGSFRVVNTSDTACSVEGGGEIGVLPQGGTDSSRVSVVDHTAGDAAPALPDPITTPDQLVLKPGQAYEVKFAWVPAEGGGTTGCSAPPPSPTPVPSKAPGEKSPDSSTSVSGEGGGSTTGGSQAGGNEGTPGGGSNPPGGIVLSHTPEAGEPAAADVKLPDACAGTVYRTEPLPAQ